MLGKLSFYSGSLMTIQSTGGIVRRGRLTGGAIAAVVAKRRSPGGIELLTFQRNHRAQDFYKSRGFQEAGRGFASLDDNPWATHREQLADIRFRWEP